MWQRWRRAVWSVIGLMVLVVVAAQYEERTVRRREQEFDRRMGRVRDGMTEADVRNAVGVPDQTFDDPHPPDKGPFSGSCDNANAVTSMLYSFDREFWGMSVGGSSLVVCLDASRVVIDTHRYSAECHESDRPSIGPAGSASRLHICCSFGSGTRSKSLDATCSPLPPHPAANLCHARRRSGTSRERNCVIVSARTGVRLVDLVSVLCSGTVATVVRPAKEEQR